MAEASPKRRGGDALVVDIELGRPKKKPPGGPARPRDPFGDDAEMTDDVKGETYAEAILSALGRRDAAALNTALKDHYRHCKAASEEEEEGAPSSRPGGIFGGAGGSESDDMGGY